MSRAQRAGRKTRWIEAERLSSIRMTTGGEKEVRFVIDGSKLKEWVGIGWIEVRTATCEDRRNYPEVRR
jgi:hypothetical protein